MTTKKREFDMEKMATLIDSKIRSDGYIDIDGMEDIFQAIDDAVRKGKVSVLEKAKADIIGVSMHLNSDQARGYRICGEEVNNKIDALIAEIEREQANG